MDNNNQMSWLKLPENKQLPGKYTSLITSISIALLASLGLIYVAGGILDFTEVISMVVLGRTVPVDFVYTVINIVFHVLIFLLPMKLFKTMHGRSNSEKYMPVEKEIINKKTVLPVFLLGLCSIFVAWVISSAFTGGFLDYTGLGDDMLKSIGLQYGYQIIAYFVTLALIPAIGEELFCRKMICNALDPYGQRTAILVSAVMFSLLHADFNMFLHTFVAGIFFAWLYVGTKKIWISMLLHFINNFLPSVYALFYYAGEEDLYISLLSNQFAFSLIVGIICLIYLINQRKKALKKEKSDAMMGEEYEAYLEKKAKYKNQIEMLPSEDGEEVIPISKKEKIKGFFTPINIIYMICCIVVAWLKLT